MGKILPDQATASAGSPVQGTGRIPVVDLAGFDEGAPDKRMQVAAAVGDACAGVGFFFVVNHGVPRAVVDGAFTAARRFFAQPLETKMAIAMAQHSRCFRGYSPVFAELADGKRNWYEIVEFGVDLPPSDAAVAAGKPMHGPNLWPADLPGYRASIEAYTRHLRQLGFTLMQAMALSLDLEERYFIDAFFGEPHWVFRTAHYPDRAAAAKAAGTTVDQAEIGDLSCSAHTDYGFLTMLIADEPGLEVQMRDGTWVTVAPLADAFICNIGDTLQFWTNDRYVATRHRVQTTGPRLSLPFFFQPNYETEIRPLAGPGGGRQGCYQPLKYGPYAFAKYRAIYPACTV